MHLEDQEVVWQAYNTLGRLLRDLRVSESPEKSIPPAEEIEFLGVLYNFRKQTISVTNERMQELHRELEQWG